ncbi:Cof-type HAD-IIB family hydrolase [Superficieibacter electus]|uniref:Cof-type HAD-IIB family hydrolase n=1 Tax=Superficieibacter electus TaxID=2022662 RepID=UPI001FE803B8|nr:Cof-type HAD-IIB family hydrolase [Superficieibacter electus]
MLLVTDLDGTLLTSQKTISPRTRQALGEFHQRGGLLAACSARPVSSMVHLLEQQNVDALFSWCAGFNGGQILEMAQHAITHAAPLSGMDLRDIDRHISLSRYAHHFFSAEAIYHRYDRPVAPWTTYEAELFMLPLIPAAPGVIISRTDIYKITVVAEQSKINQLHTDINSQLPPGFIATITGGNYIDIQRAQINKGYAVSQLIRHISPAATKVVAIGDQQNDVSMFAAADIGIAMGNAPEAVKQRASYVTATNDDEGIVRALEWLR